MKGLLENQFIKKGFFALAVVAVAGVGGFVYAAPNDTAANSESGYGVQQGAQDATNRLNDDYQASSDEFRTEVRRLVAEYQNTRSTPGGENAAQFGTEFEAASTELDSTMADARNDFLADIQAAASTAESKDQFIDRYNRAKAEYFNRLDVAKNKFEDATNRLGDSAANAAKSRFINGFNSARDAYGNELEVIKNQFADTISNLPRSSQQ